MNSARMALHTVSLVGRRGSVTPSEVAAELGVARSTAHRVLGNCVAAGFVRQDVTGGPYLVGRAVHELALGATSAVHPGDAREPFELRAGHRRTSRGAASRERSAR